MKSKTITLVAYSDIHHHYWQNGITEDDIAAVEDEVISLANERRADCVLFGGDAYQLHNPPSSLRNIVDGCVAAQAMDRRVIRLVGNHDRELRSMHSSHSAYHYDYFHPPFPITIMALAKDYHFPEIDLTITAVPAGHAIVPPALRVSSFHLCVFHDILTGSVHDNGVKEAKGVSPALFDIPGFDMVLGGDNHVPQKLDFQNTRGWYIGAPCQHDWGDINQDRGFIVSTLEARPEGVGIIEFERVSSKAPKFMKFDEQVVTLQQTENRFKDDASLKGNVVKIILKGDARVLSNVQMIQALENTLMASSGARQIKIVTDPIVTFQELIPALKDSKTPEDDWAAYVASGKLDVRGLDPQVLINMGMELIRTVRRA